MVIDLPDPSNFSLGKLYSVPFYRLLAKHVAAGGFIVVQSTSPWFAPRAYWSINETLKAAGFKTWPYHLYVPSFGEWGFVAASVQGDFTNPKQYNVQTRFLTSQNSAAMFEFPPDMPRPVVEPNYLNTQRLVEYFEDDWARHSRR